MVKRSFALRLSNWILILNIVFKHEVTSFRCDRRPYGSITQSLPADGRFKLDVVGADDTYIPEQVYIVQITATDDDSVFTSFVISAEGDTKVDPRNPRRLITLYPGELRPQSPLTAKINKRCSYSVEQAMASVKSSVEVYWHAPESGNGCVILRAMVAENAEVWFEDGAPLTKLLCEDMRQPDDFAPQLNLDCQICDEAKYELTFTGLWSRNTHPQLFPENDWTTRYSDLVGASHDINYVLWQPGSLASEGFKIFAEHANSSDLEVEIREKIGDGVRTLVKGKGHKYPKMSNPTYAFFRADKTNHLFTAAVAFHPSPDWFLGVSRFELCQDNAWLAERELRLYPWDAGTDSGVSYESPNIVTHPQDAINRVEMSSYDRNSPFYEIDIKEMHPFGILNVKLIKTYQKDCEEEKEEESTETTEETTTTEGTTESTEEPSENDLNEPANPSRYQNTPLDSDERRGEPPLVADPKSSAYCPLSEWQEWTSCSGICENGKLYGYRSRERYHLVDGVAVEKYDPDAKDTPKKEVPKFCKDQYEDFDREECEEDCS